MTSRKIRKILRVVTTPVVSRWNRWLSSMLPYSPMRGGEDVLNAEYARGLWDYLGDVTELPRFSVIVGFCHHYRGGGKILEIGCGEGILWERLCPTKYASYVGVDVSAEAIRRASHKQNEKTQFVREDASVFQPDERFDLIVFNECLEYFDDPLKLLRRYEDFLEEDGIYIVSMFVGLDTVRTKRIWKMIGSVYTAEAETRVSTRKKLTWTIKVFSPLQSKRPVSRILHAESK